SRFPEGRDRPTASDTLSRSRPRSPSCSPSRPGRRELSLPETRRSPQPTHSGRIEIVSSEPPLHTPLCDLRRRRRSSQVLLAHIYAPISNGVKTLRARTDSAQAL